MRYLKKTKDYVLTYRRLDHLEIIRYSESDFAGCQDSRKSTSGYIYMLVCGCSDPRARSDPNGKSEPKPREAC